MLAKDPAERPEARVVEERLRELLDELDVPAPRAWRPSGGHNRPRSGEIPVVSKTDPNARKRTPLEIAPTLDSQAVHTAPIPRATELSAAAVRRAAVMPAAPKPKRGYFIASAAAVAIAIGAFVLVRGSSDEPAPATKPAEPAIRAATPPPQPTVVKINFTSVP